MKIHLEKEPDNRHGHEAIRVLLDGVGHISYVTKVELHLEQYRPNNAARPADIPLGKRENFYGET